jgi:hypothetical protein
MSTQCIRTDCSENKTPASKKNGHGFHGLHNFQGRLYSRKITIREICEIRGCIDPFFHASQGAPRRMRSCSENSSSHVAKGFSPSKPQAEPRNLTPCGFHVPGRRAEALHHESLIQGRFNALSFLNKRRLSCVTGCATAHERLFGFPSNHKDLEEKRYAGKEG